MSDVERMAAARQHLRRFRPILFSRPGRVVAAGTSELTAADDLAAYHVAQLEADTVEYFDGTVRVIADDRALEGHIVQVRR